MGLYNIRLAVAADNAALLQLCEVPIPGAISLTFERRPDFFAAAHIQCNQPEIYICIDAKGKAAGMFGVGIRHVWIRGRESHVRYFSDLRVAAGVNGTRLFLEMCRFVQSKGISGDFSAQTVVFRDNLPMVELIKSGNTRSARLGLPYYHLRGCYVSYLLSLTNKPKASSNAWNIQQAQAVDLPRIQAFYERESKDQSFAPVFDFSMLGSGHYAHLHITDFYLLESNNHIKAVAAVWDQKVCKQTRVVAYSPWLKWLRPLVNALTIFSGDIKLPPQGQFLDYVNLFAPMVNANDPEAFHALINHILREKHGGKAAYLLVGMMQGHPLELALQRFQHKRKVFANFYWVTLADVLPEEYNAPHPYFEISRI